MPCFTRTDVERHLELGYTLLQTECGNCAWRAYGCAPAISIAEHAHICLRATAHSCKSQTEEQRAPIEVFAGLSWPTTSVILRKGRLTGSFARRR